MALFFTYALPLVLPTAIYLLWRLIMPRRPVAGANGGADMTADDAGGTAATNAAGDLWRDAPWVWLTFAGAVLLALVLLVGVFVHGSPPRAQYVPPRMENGQIVPGELRPADAGAERSGGTPTISPGGTPSGVR